MKLDDEMPLSSSSKFARVALAASTALALSGCGQWGGLRENIREHDYRQVNIQKRMQAAPPSPVANIYDMPDWTSDLQSAQAFAASTGGRVVLFIQRPNNQLSEANKRALLDPAIKAALADTQKVSLDYATADQLGYASYDAPSVTVFGPDKEPISTRTGVVNGAMLRQMLGAR